MEGENFMPETKRITTKDLTIGGKEYRIKKMDARLASYVAFECKSFMPGSNDAGKMIGGAQSGMSRKEFFSLQNDCLSVCFHIEKAGEIAVLDAVGNFQNKELECDAKTVILLTVQSLAFNVTDFFGEEFLREFSTAIESMMPSPAKM
jgi:hypothetical protein